MNVHDLTSDEREELNQIHTELSTVLYLNPLPHVDVVPTFEEYKRMYEAVMRAAQTVGYFAQINSIDTSSSVYNERNLIGPADC